MTYVTRRNRSAALIGVSLLQAIDILILCLLPSQARTAETTAEVQCMPHSVSSSTTYGHLIWSGRKTYWPNGWGQVKFQFGDENLDILPPTGVYTGQILRVHYPKKSIDPGSAAKGLAPLGGTQFTARLPAFRDVGHDVVTLSYKVRFAKETSFMRGGKLPGLYGGIPRSGGQIPNGSDGFSTRVVWQSYGEGAVYAYLPSSKVWGTLFGKGKWRFHAGQWTQVAHRVRLNTPGKDNGEIMIWIDGKIVHQQCGLRFRDVSTLKIDGIFFSTFFGGNDPSWATPVDTYVDFSDFEVYISR